MRLGKLSINLQTDDTTPSREMMREALREILKNVKLDRSHDVPYLGGSSSDGSTIYVDRHMPKTMTDFGKRVNVEQFVILHEAVEKALLSKLGLQYQHAHQIALRAEEAAVRASGLSWRKYQRFMGKYSKEASDERLQNLPVDLDIKPYKDERDVKLLRAMQSQMSAERRGKSRGRPRSTRKT